MSTSASFNIATLLNIFGLFCLTLIIRDHGTTYLDFKYSTIVIGPLCE